jgi:hypothetical protein
MFVAPSGPVPNCHNPNRKPDEQGIANDFQKKFRRLSWNLPAIYCASHETELQTGLAGQQMAGDIRQAIQIHRAGSQKKI